MTQVSWTQAGLYAAVRFTLCADASPGVLPRVLETLARRDLVPDSLEATRQGDELLIRLALAAMPAELVGSIQGNLGQIVGMRSVQRRQEVTGLVSRAA